MTECGVVQSVFISRREKKVVEKVGQKSHKINLLNPLADPATGMSLRR